MTPSFSESPRSNEVRGTVTGTGATSRAAQAAVATNRFGLGARPDEDLPQDPVAWLLDQLEPGRYQALPPAWAAQPRSGQLVAEMVDEQRMARAETDEQARRELQKMGRKARRGVYVDAVGARVQSALTTPTPFVERLVHFWSNHFAVSIDKATVVGLAGAFEADAIRPHVLGRFDDLLLAAVRHPAMLLFLDQAQSVGPQSTVGERSAARENGKGRGLNENLGREIMELHTLGVRSGYTQTDVTEFARALTGWSIPRPADPANVVQGVNGFLWRPQIHEPGARTLLGRTYPDQGPQQPEAMLRDLARSEATATHVATQLLRHFVADEPPMVLVREVSATFLRTDGDLAAVYRTLVVSGSKLGGTASKFKSPWDWAISSWRALGRVEVPPMQAVNVLNQLGQPTWRPGSPAGWGDDAQTWAAPDALLRRVEFAQRLAQQAGFSVDARQLAPRVLPDVLSRETAQQIGNSESPGGALALLLVSPEFMRR